MLGSKRKIETWQNSSSDQFGLVAQSYLTLVTPWTAARQASLSVANSQRLPKLMSIESVMPFNHLILCHLFSACPQSFPASESFQMSQFFTTCGQSIGVSASASILPMKTQDWSPLGWIGWISLQPKQLSRVFSNTTVEKHQFFWFRFLYSPTLTSIQDMEKTWPWQIMSLLFNMLSRLVMTFLPRSKCLLISWLQSPSAVIVEPPKNKVSHYFHCGPVDLPRSHGTGCHDISFLNVEF